MRTTASLLLIALLLGACTHPTVQRWHQQRLTAKRTAEETGEAVPAQPWHALKATAVDTLREGAMLVAAGLALIARRIYRL